MFRWTNDMVRFMIDASEHTEYYTRLGDKIAEFLPSGGHICDAGCGLGYLSAELSRRFAKVTAIDIAPQAVQVLQRRMQAQNLTNLHIQCGDIFCLPPAEPYDGMVFCLFGGIGQILQLAARQCRGKVVVFKKNYAAHRFSLSKPPLRHYTFADSIAALQHFGIAYHAELSSIELGQPLRSLADAVTFFQTYSRDDDPSQITAEAVRGRLVETGDTEFPFYLPEHKNMGILVLDVKDIPPEFAEKEPEIYVGTV